MGTGRGTSHTGVYWGVGGWGGTEWGGEVGEGFLGEMPDVGDRGMEAANHLAMCVPVQQSCKICICTPKPKMQLKKRKERKG